MPIWTSWLLFAIIAIISPLSTHSIAICTGCILSQIDTRSPDNTLTLASASVYKGCDQMSIECPINSRFKIVYANGAIVDNFYTTPIVFKCSSSSGVAASSGSSRLSALTPILDSNLIAKLRLYGINLKSTVFWIGHTTGLQVVTAHCYRPPPTTSTTTKTATTKTTTSAASCTTCSLSTLNNRNDHLTSVRLTTLNDCLAAEIACVGTARYRINYRDGSIEDFFYDNASLTPPSSTAFHCNRHGEWRELQSAGRIVDAFFCYQTIDVVDCAECNRSTTSPAIAFSNINVPLYNRSRSNNADMCCSPVLGTRFQATNTTTPLSTIFTSSNPAYPGVIGTANCSSTGTNKHLCICGYLQYNDFQSNCYIGDGDAHVYLMQYCNSSCIILAIPFVGVLKQIGSSGGGVIQVPDFSDIEEYNPDDLWPRNWPVVDGVACVSHTSQCVAPFTR